MLELQQLTMTNFRRFKSAAINFNSGLTGIVGPNGAGKSTILDGIGYAFYGAVPVIVRTIKDDMKHTNARDDEDWGVILTFTMNDYDYELTRMTRVVGEAGNVKQDVQLKRKTAGSKLDYTTLAKDDTDVKLVIRNLLGMDYQSFSSSVFCRQAEVATLGNMNPADRKKLILDMVGIDGLDDALKALRKHKKGLTASADAVIESLLDADGNDVKNSYITNKNQAKADIKVAMTELDKFETELKVIDKALDNLVKERKTKLIDRGEIERMKNTWTDKLLTIKNIEKLKHSIKTFEKQVDDTCARKVPLNAGLLAQDDDNKKMLADVLLEERMVLQAVDVINARVEGLKALDATAKCPTCYQDIVGGDAIIAEQEAESVKLGDKAVVLEKRVGELRNVRLQIEVEKGKETNNDKINFQVKPLTDSIASLKKELIEAEHSANGITGSVGDITKKIAEHADGLKVIDDTIAKNDSEQSLRRGTRDIANENITQCKLKITRAETTIEHVDKSLMDYESKQKLVKKSGEEVSKYNQTEELMNEFKLYLIGRIRPMLSYFTSELVQAMTDGNYTRVDIDENYNIIVYDGGIGYNLQRFSGGEQDVVNLSLRLALSQLISEQAGTQGAGFIILDEVFGSADADRRLSILETLSGLDNKYKQIICISHITEVIDTLPDSLSIEIVDDQSIISV